jgi:uncharacterized Zn-finger protein
MLGSGEVGHSQKHHIAADEGSRRIQANDSAQVQGESMSKLVRARPKAFDNLDDRFKCCDEFILKQASEPETFFDLDITETEEMVCSYCGADYGILHGAMDTRVGKFDALELYDLDEGPTA